MFDRTVETNLAKWKESITRKPLILRGARQVGKTSVVRKFAREKFDNLVEINLEKENYRKYLAGADNVEEFIRRSELLTNGAVIEGKTLMFIDEIQESIEALKLLRFFAEEKPNLHLITAGSLLEAKMTKEWSVPVGRIEYMFMFPMTFSEFLKALGQERFLDENNFELSHNELNNQLKNYLLVGGMPEAVENFKNEGSFVKTQSVQNKLTQSYKDDLDKYANIYNKKYLELVMDFGPKVAGGIYKYENFGGSGYRSREISEAFHLLSKIMLLNEVPPINSVNLPLIYKLKRAKKLLWLDVGIVNYLNRITIDILSGEYKGKIMEQFVGQTLEAFGIERRMDLVYWARNKDEGSAEVDFCYQLGDKIVALEVKSGEIARMKSLFSMMDDGGDRVVAVRVSWDPMKREEYVYNGKKYQVLNIPFYLVEKLEEFI